MQKANLVLSLFALILLVVVYFSSREPESVEQSILFSSQLSQYSTIMIERRGEQPIFFSKVNQDWQVQYAQNSLLSASEWKLQQLVKNLALRDYETLEQVSDYSQFDLEQPLITLTLDEKKVRFGNTNPISRKRYVGIDGDVYLIKDDVYRHVIGEWFEYVDKTLFGKDQKIASVEFNQSRLIRTDDGRWEHSLPQADLSMDQIQAYIDAWQFAEAVNLAEYQTKPSTSNVKIGFSDGTSRQFIGRVENDRLILVDPLHMLEYHFSNTASRQLAQFQ